MERFHIVDEAAVIIRSKGVYRQAKVYRRGDDLYAGHGSGFIGLRARGGTTLPNVSWDDIETPFDLAQVLHGPLKAAPPVEIKSRRRGA